MDKIVKAREIQIPHDLAEKIDASAKRPAGTIRNLIADEGKLHELDRKLLAISMARELRSAVKNVDLPTSKPMTLQRFSEISWAMLFAYVLGTYTFNEDGQLEIGTMRDVLYIDEIMKADYVELREGIKISPEILISVLKTATNETALKQIWSDIVGKSPFKRAAIKTSDAMHYAETLLDVTDKMMGLISPKSS